jgi:glutathione peroxidase
MQNLYERYKDKGFMIIGFPCNQFGNQERDNNQKIQQFLKKKGVTFPVFGKINVNGKDQDPLYKYLKNQKKDIFFGEDIKWNFTKFLCYNGVPVKRYGPQINPYSFEEDIKNLLN